MFVYEFFYKNRLLTSMWNFFCQFLLLDINILEVSCRPCFEIVAHRGLVSNVLAWHMAKLSRRNSILPINLNLDWMHRWINPNKIKPIHSCYCL